MTDNPKALDKIVKGTEILQRYAELLEKRLHEKKVSKVIKAITK